MSKTNAESNDYVNDVFISLSHNSITLSWIEDVFVDQFRSRLAHELGKPEHEVKIWWARKNITGGEDWKNAIVSNLAKSKSMVALLCRTYRNREWCQREYSMMRARELFHAPSKPKCSLVVPVFIHDGKDKEFKEILGGIQPISLVEPDPLFSICMSPRGEEARKVERLICQIVESTVQAISNAPNYTPDFETVDYELYLSRFRSVANHGVTTGVPGRDL